MVSPVTFITEKRDASWLVVAAGANGFRKEIRFDGPYEPARSEVGGFAVYWSGNQIVALDPISGREYQLHCREFVQYVLPIDSDRMWVVADTYVSIIDLRTWHEEIIVDHDEVFREVNWDGRTLTLTDLQEKLMNIAVPDAAPRR